MPLALDCFSWFLSPGVLHSVRFFSRGSDGKFLSMQARLEGNDFVNAVEAEEIEEDEAGFEFDDLFFGFVFFGFPLFFW